MYVSKVFESSCFQLSNLSNCVHSRKSASSKDPSQPPHATKNRPDKDEPADVARGQAYVESIGLANARDVLKMLRWNDRYGIKFMRLSSEMFPFASHEVYGYKLAPFASEVLADAGKTAAD
jgi:UV DNA damage endonuclease